MHTTVSSLIRWKDGSLVVQLPCNSALCTGLPFPMCNNNSCVYWYAYGDGSLTTGDFVYDTITLDITNGQQQQVHMNPFICFLYDNHKKQFSVAEEVLLLVRKRIHLLYQSEVMNISEELDMQVGCEIFPPKNSTVRP